ncbi:peptidase M16 domain protein [Alkaliphilus metalliredigens QYMF]|uniref:Peptidase M16 domain protein n=1 Tax=Alkaliphilus metalliredigens (strain QYMF) TaxID=293826 RepID=A6TS74_ALKMQ|nr:pitrilysin family protein [Alkaliphilus metalliredigens]ABR49042.1 peptidase M16 domain protein [Alkaliphilus metalliredigens QYMF]
MELPKRTKINEGVYLHTLRVGHFKTNIINFNIQRPLTKEEVTYNALLPMILERGTQSHPTSKAISDSLDYLYGASFNTNVDKKGERQIIQFSLMLANDQFVEESVFEKGLVLLNEIIHGPFLENGAFKKEYVNQEKKNLQDRISGRINDKMSYSLERCAEEMCKEEPFHIFPQGEIEDLEGIDETKLYKHYKKVMETSPIDIVVVGDIQHEKIVKMIKDTFKFNRKTVLENEREKVNFEVNKVNEVEENMEINQGKLTLGYRTNIPYEEAGYAALMVYSSILGGGAHSKLFLKVREEKSLCYYIFSQLEKFKSLMLISSGIEEAQYGETIKAVENQLKEMESGNISDMQMEHGKKAVITNLESLRDSSNGLANFILSQSLSQTNETINTMIEKIRGVAKADVVEVAEKIELDTIYFLKKA